MPFDPKEIVIVPPAKFGKDCEMVQAMRRSISRNVASAEPGYAKLVEVADGEDWCNFATVFKPLPEIQLFLALIVKGVVESNRPSAKRNPTYFYNVHCTGNDEENGEEEHIFQTYDTFEEAIAAYAAIDDKMTLETVWKKILKAT